MSALTPSTSTSTPTPTSAIPGESSNESREDGPRSRFGGESAMSLLVDSLKDRVLFAIPKKGRLHEKCLELLAGADIKFNRAHRLDVALVQNHPIALVFLPAGDIPRFVALGNVAIGITGQDMISESTHSHLLTQILPLGFGKCALQIQVPVSGPYQTVEALAGRRVATSFEVLSKEFFGEVDRRLASEGEGKVGEGEGGKERGRQGTSVEYVGGSVEAACALGMADGIVDLVESGDTMRAAGLHAIHTLLTSEAVLITPSTPHPSLTPTLAPLIPLIKSRIAGVLAAKRYVLVSYNIHVSKLQSAMQITPGRRSCTVSKLEEEGWMAVQAMVERSEVADKMDLLQEGGAEDVLVLGMDNCRV